MNVHEYQGKEILRRFGVATPRGVPCFSVADADAAARELGGKVWVVKAQIHAGGRGKGGGVKVAKSLEEVHEYASRILGMTLVTHQSGPEGRVVKRLLVEEGADIRKELYVGMVVDRASQRVTLMASSEGGMEIEEVAARAPEKIHKVAIDPVEGLTEPEADDISRKIGVPEASLALALDAKFNFDSNALFRHSDIVAMRDLDEEDPAEIEASKYDLSYISLNGNIGCLVNGAGLAMATMDTIKLVGGGATAQKVTEAFKLMLKNPAVKGILVNIFGGIMRCDTIAEGVIAAAKEVKLSVPLVVRMKGTNEELGRKALAASGLPIISADNMADAAQKIVAAVNGSQGRPA